MTRKRKNTVVNTLTHEEQLERRRAHYHANRALFRAQSKRWRDMTNETAQRRERDLKFYGLTNKSFEELIVSQGGCCAICRVTEPGGRGTWHIDHDHACCNKRVGCKKCFRGLLCRSCNSGIGQLKDDPRILRRAIDYLEAPPSMDMFALVSKAADPATWEV